LISVQDNTTGGEQVPWTLSISVENGCSDGRTLLLSSVDANGVPQNLTGVGEIDANNITGAFPMNVSVWFADSPEDVTVISYFMTSFTYQLGCAAIRESCIGNVVAPC
jgi:hypothetical protein